MTASVAFDLHLIERTRLDSLLVPLYMLALPINPIPFMHV